MPLAITLPMPTDAVAPAWAALQKAKALEPNASPEERAWIEALAARYSADPKADRFLGNPRRFPRISHRPSLISHCHGSESLWDRL